MRERRTSFRCAVDGRPYRPGPRRKRAPGSAPGRGPCGPALIATVEAIEDARQIAVLKCRCRYRSHESARCDRSDDACNSTRPPRGVYLIALSTRLASAWRKRSRSAVTTRPGGDLDVEREARGIGAVFVEFASFPASVASSTGETLSFIVPVSASKYPSAWSASTTRARFLRGNPTAPHAASPGRWWPAPIRR